MISSHRLTDFVAGLPKAELHVHHVGSASPRIVAELAARHPGGSVPDDPAALADYFAFTDFAHFAQVYLSVVDLIRTPDDIRTLSYEIAMEMAAQRIRYAELTCTPYTSVARGIAAEQYCEAIEDARAAAERDLGVVLRWIFDIPGEFGLPAAEETLRIATTIAPAGLVGFGLGGPEIGVPRAQFAPYFAAAAAAGLHRVPHAGESTGPRSIWDAIQFLDAERIGHGTSAADDPGLVAYLAEHEIPLEVCPTSNVATRVVDSLDRHPIRLFHSRDVVFSVNSDDPPMFGTTLTREYLVAADLLGLAETGTADLARAAVRQSFAPDQVKRRVLAEIDEYAAAALGHTADSTPH